MAINRIVLSVHISVSTIFPLLIESLTYSIDPMALISTTNYISTSMDYIDKKCIMYIIILLLIQFNLMNRFLETPLLHQHLILDRLLIVQAVRK